jgi:hypothetical protein
MVGRVVRTLVFPSPGGGLDTVTPREKMAPDVAVRLSNLFPGDLALRSRGGTRLHCNTGDATRSYTLFGYADGSSVKLLSAHDSGAIYDVTTSTPSTLATGYASADWSWVAFANSSGYYIIAANDSGSDAAWVYNGATITPVVVAGVANTALSRVCVYLQRVFYAERNSLSVWYSAAGAFQGALTELDLSSYATRGGKIAAISTWTRDNGTGGMDDLFVVVTSRGQLLIFQGIDPSVSTLWNLAGVFDVGLPVDGPSCLVRTGPDLILISTDGYRPLSDYLALGQSAASESGLSWYISGVAKQFTAGFLNDRGWEGIIYPKENMLIINLPIVASAQHAVNLRTGRWCTFQGIDASSWGRMGQNVYCGVPGGKIYLFDTASGDGDSGATPTQCILQTAFQRPTGALVNARTTSVSPVLSGAVTNYRIGVPVNYEVITGAPPGPYVNGDSPNLVVGGSSTTTPPMNLFSTIGREFSVYFSFNRFAGDPRIDVWGFRVNYEPGSAL